MYTSITVLILERVNRYGSRYITLVKDLVKRTHVLVNQVLGLIESKAQQQSTKICCCSTLEIRVAY